MYPNIYLNGGGREMGMVVTHLFAFSKLMELYTGKGEFLLYVNYASVNLTLEKWAFTMLRPYYWAKA